MFCALSFFLYFYNYCNEVLYIENIDGREQYHNNVGSIGYYRGDNQHLGRRWSNYHHDTLYRTWLAYWCGKRHEPYRRSVAKPNLIADILAQKNAQHQKRSEAINPRNYWKRLGIDGRYTYQRHNFQDLHGGGIDHCLGLYDIRQ